MNKILLISIFSILLLLSVVFSSCQSGTTGVPQSDYDQVLSQLTAAQEQLGQAQANLASLQLSKDAVDSQLADALTDIASLEARLAALQAQYDLTGVTPAETARKIVSYYHETHVYSSYDLFVCSDMAAEVANMLQAAGIDSVIAVGRIDAAISDILDSNHAWVLAGVGSGQFLALETTGGFAVAESDNPFYYQGWSFDSPADLKAYNDLVQEYNTRVGFRNLLADEYNSSTNPAVRDKLHELMTDQETILNTIMAQINGLAAVIQ
jgi:hypothetical protein